MTMGVFSHREKNLKVMIIAKRTKMLSRMTQCS